MVNLKQLFSDEACTVTAYTHPPHILGLYILVYVLEKGVCMFCVCMHRFCIWPQVFNAGHNQKVLEYNMRGNLLCMGLHSHTKIKMSVIFHQSLLALSASWKNKLWLTAAHIAMWF